MKAHFKRICEKLIESTHPCNIQRIKRNKMLIIIAFRSEIVAFPTLDVIDNNYNYLEM